MLNHQRVLQHTFSLPTVLGTGIIIRSAELISPPTKTLIEQVIKYFEDILSRFHKDSLVTQISHSDNGGEFYFPQWCIPLFNSYDNLVRLSSGTFDPCIGADLVELGYDARESFIPRANAFQHLGAVRGRGTWATNVSRAGSVLTCERPLTLDFGACGKGFCVDLIRALLDTVWSGTLDSDHPPTPDQALNIAAHKASTTDGQDGPPLVIDAGGDLFVRLPSSMPIALEDPANLTWAIGQVHVANASVCASAPSRRHWDFGGSHFHHLLDALTGLPVNSLQASWVVAPTTTPFSTMLADGLATVLFTVPAEVLAEQFHFDCALLGTDRHVSVTRHFPGTFSTH